MPPASDESVLCSRVSGIPESQGPGHGVCGAGAACLYQVVFFGSHPRELGAELGGRVDSCFSGRMRESLEELCIFIDHAF